MRVLRSHSKVPLASHSWAAPHFASRISSLEDVPNPSSSLTLPSHPLLTGSVTTNLPTSLPSNLRALFYSAKFRLYPDLSLKALNGFIALLTKSKAQQAYASSFLCSTTLPSLRTLWVHPPRSDPQLRIACPTLQPHSGFFCMKFHSFLCLTFA